jgi:D-alanine-D-alanine ligase
MIKNKKIAVLMGGWNSEREVSLRSGEASYQALIALGYTAVKIDFSHKIFEQLQKEKPDIVFNALHGTNGEDGRIQGVLDILEIPYTQSGIIASAICMDKVLTRKLCYSAGVKSPAYEILRKGENEKNAEKISKIGKPFVIKPIAEGSSVGVEIILRDMAFDFSNYDWKYGDEIIIEKYVAGQEVQVAVMGIPNPYDPLYQKILAVNPKAAQKKSVALGAIEVRPKHLFYDYTCKYTPGMTDYIMPAEIPAEKYREILELSEKCHDVVGCRGVSRIDFILNNKDGGDNNFYLLEVNTHPGFTATSLVPKIAKHVGISFEEIVEFLVKTAKFG